MNQPIARSASKPLYNQIRDELLQKITNGTYPANSQIPSENELRELFQVSRITLTQLQQEGFIFKVHGKGSFVSKPKAFQNVTHLQGFAEALSTLGHEVINDVRQFDFVTAPIDVAAKLQLPVGSTVTVIKRIRRVNQQPVSFEITYLPESLGHELQQVNLVTTDIFLALEEVCQTQLTVGCQ
ncbi:GntR family transcriptional regulator [Alkanindiges illinoisensis]|uniref:GntR family transcriptional regulator n=1 Tax=Alkanindiges illinoisensis TaxID=197183 RepID=A0A4Y7XGB1_9GAMM|nr:GntR family transcriptional regulator [Alkanindiges illinoisensis]TEU30582.1 GntR family transcriptional regulator [Alkanindiges illinoisensis]